MDRLITCDERTGNIALVINQQLTDLDGVPTINYKSRIIIFDSDLSTNWVILRIMNTYLGLVGIMILISIFLDIESTLGVVGTTVNTQLSDEVNNEGILDGLVSNTITTSASNSDILQNNCINCRLGAKKVTLEIKIPMITTKMKKISLWNL
ncbi:CRB_1a_G0054770.mRNA.1.CDS.1 [Saccharomyces cerevisiae]|nr:CRB_1a_G0054770.mRNA.1.CDS.1 [Saccharomyces cerevisiae]CAI7479983.1 CRB_1a_G0054770.mRNA.1.CDS.1 [Saccharomyces cerevisiae]